MTEPKPFMKEWPSLPVTTGGAPRVMTLPPGITPLNPLEFVQRFPQIQSDLLRHLVSQLRIGEDETIQSEAQARRAGEALADRLAGLAQEGKVQFGVSTSGEPGVFTAPSTLLTNEEYQLTQALVHYFDSTGSFNEQTGEVVESNEIRLAKIAHEIKKLYQEAAALNEVAERLQTLEPHDYLALALMAEGLGATSAKLVEVLGNALQQAPTMSVQDFIASLLAAWRKKPEAEQPHIDVVEREVRRVYELREAPASLEPVYPPASLDDWMTKEAPRMLEECASELHTSKRVIREILDAWVGAGALSFVRTPQGILGAFPDDWPPTASRTERGLQAIFARRFKILSVTQGADGAPVVTPLTAPAASERRVVSTVPLPPERHRYQPGDATYMRALEAQYATLANLQEEANLLSRWLHTPGNGEQLPHDDSWGRLENWMIDLRAMRAADTYCWFDEPTRAVEHAAAVFPDSVRLTPDLFDGTAGFWYFLSPRDVQTVSDADLPIVALLWAWTGKALRITALLPSERGLQVSTVGMWPEGMTLAMALQEAQTAYRRVYRNADPKDLIGEQQTLAALEYMLRFFLMGWLWIRERIPVLTRQGLRPDVANKGKRKRLEEAARRLQRPLGDIQVIQLRRKAVTRLDDPNIPEEERTRAWEYSCRWIVQGHVRNQYYPSEGRHKPKWIDSYPKGPEDKPLRTPTKRIYAVNR
jgi:hypothetical protein